MADVFISYAREDQPQAAQIAHALEAMGLTTFWDTAIPPGQTWADYIEAKLAQCKAVIVLWSAHSTQSHWVREEARMGRDRGRLIPAMLDGSAPPFGFGEVQAANLSAWRGETDNSEWRRFATAVYGAVKGTDAPPQQPAASGWTATASSSTPSQGAWASASPATGASAPSSAMEYVQKCLRLYVNGQGRARRKEYAWFVAFFALVMIVAAVADIAVFGLNPYTNMANQYVLTPLAWLVLVCPFTSATSRRAHDFGQSGWFAIIAPMPYLGALAALIFTCIPGQAGPNQYGPNPKGV